MVESELHTMIAEDEGHWWYRGRRRVLRAQIDRLALAEHPRILDAGCGSGRMLDELAQRGRVTGVDVSPDAVRAARSRGHRDVRVGRVERIPAPAGAFDLVTCLDVIEHTPDDRATLRELRRVTRPGGVLVATVPAYQGLWSHHDERNGHFRRYTRRSLAAAAAESGWEVAEAAHFNSLLLVPAAAVRLVARLRRPGSGSDLSLTPRSLNKLLELPLRAEAALIGHGVRLPAGLSVLAVLVNPATVPVAASDTLRRSSKRAGAAVAAAACTQGGCPP